MQVLYPENLLPETWINESVYDKLQIIAQKFPQKIAVCFQEQTYTYSEFLVEVNKFASVIQQKQKNNQQPVAIYLNNSPQCLISMFACLAIGLPYTVLDKAFPLERNRGIIHQSNAQIIVSTSNLIHEFVDVKSVNFILIDNLDTNENSFTKTAHLQSIAYIIYTSGSTGAPKGVYQNQQNLLHDVWQYINSINLTHTDCCTLLYSPAVNGAIRDIYGSLLSGASLFMMDIQQNGFQSLPFFIQQHQITVYHSVPIIYRTVLKIAQVQQLQSIRLVYLAGDCIFTSDYNLFKKYFKPSAFLYVGIGSTEIATIYHQCIYNHLHTINENLLPLGYPVDHRFTKIINENDEELVNQPGEIVVESKYISLGYWLNDELTNQYFTFLPNGHRVFKTGDWGIMNENGLLRFLGRKDNQIKIKGHRVELDEIVALIKNINGVNEVIIIPREIEGNTHLIAYVECEISPEQIKKHLSDCLPNYMLPNQIYCLANLPKLSNFKIDKKAILLLDAKNMSHQNQYSSIDNFKNLWVKYCKIDNFEQNLSWKNSGANSIEMINFWSELEDVLNIKIPINFLHPDMFPLELLEKIKSINIPSDNFAKKEVLYIIFPAVQGIAQRHRAIIEGIKQMGEIEIVKYPPNTVLYNLISIPKLEQNKSYKKINIIGLSSGAYYAYQFALENSKIPLQLFIFNCKAPIHNKWMAYLVKIKDCLINQKIKPQEYLYKNLRFKKYSNTLNLITLKNKMQQQNAFLNWNNYCEHINVVYLPFKHQELLNDNNIGELLKHFK